MRKYWEGMDSMVKGTLIPCLVAVTVQGNSLYGKEHEAGDGHIISNFRKQGEVNASTKFNFSFLFAIGLQPMEWYCL